MRGYRSSRERLVCSVIVGLWVGGAFFLHGEFGYPFSLHLLLNALMLLVYSIAWLAWKRWGRAAFPLRTDPPTE